MTKKKRQLMKDTGVRVQTARRIAGLSQLELAERVNVTSGAMCLIEKGRRLPSVEVLVDIAKALGASTDAILGLTTHGLCHEDQALVDTVASRLRRLRKAGGAS